MTLANMYLPVSYKIHKMRFMRSSQRAYLITLQDALDVE